MKINILEAKNRLSQLIQSSLSGEEVIISNRGNPVVRLVPVEKKKNVAISVRFGDWLRANPLPEHLLRSHEDIENSINEQRGPGIDIP